MTPQPISTADKSGDWILLWAEGMKPQPFFWDHDKCVWVQSYDANPIHWSGGPDDCGPTHWAALPTSKAFEAALKRASDPIAASLATLHPIFAEAIKPHLHGEK